MHSPPASCRYVAAGEVPPAEPVVGYSAGRRLARRSECLQSHLLFRFDLEELIELRDLEHLVDLGADLTQDQTAPDCLETFVQSNQFPQRRAREVLDVAEVQE